MLPHTTCHMTTLPLTLPLYTTSHKLTLKHKSHTTTDTLPVTHYPCHYQSHITHTTRPQYSHIYHRHYLCLTSHTLSLSHPPHKTSATLPLTNLCLTNHTLPLPHQSHTTFATLPIIHYLFHTSHTILCHTTNHTLPLPHQSRTTSATLPVTHHLCLTSYYLCHKSNTLSLPYYIIMLHYL